MDNFKSQVKQKTDDELIEIFSKSLDYQPDFIKILEEELTERNIPIAPLKKIRADAYEVSDKKIQMGEQGSTLYIALCFLFAILGGIISIVAGYIYAYSKRKDSQGKSFYYYNEQTRKYGKWMLLVGVIMLLLWLLF